MLDDKLSGGGCAQIDFDVIASKANGCLEGIERVRWSVFVRAAVSDDFDLTSHVNRLP